MSGPAAHADLLVRAGAIATMNADREILLDGVVAVSDGRIIAVGKASELARDFEAERVIELQDSLVTPGLIDAHNHPLDYLLRGAIDDLGHAGERYGGHVIPFEYGISHDEGYVSAHANFAEMLLNGTTCFCDAGGPLPDAVAQAAADSGIRGIVARRTQDIPGPFNIPIDGEVETIVGLAMETVERWNGAANGRIRARLDLAHQLSVTDDLCAAVAEQAATHDVGIIGHFHGIAHFQGKSLDDFGGERNPHVERYLSLGVLSCRPLLAHIGWLPADDIAVFAEHGVSAVHCPSQSHFGGQGMISHGVIPELIAAGVPVGLGTDAACISRFLDLVRVMYLAACAHRDARLDPLIMGAHKALEMATIDGAHALGWQDQIGSLEVGKRADMVIFDTSGPEWLPRRLGNPIPDLVYTATGHSTHTVIVDGNVVVDAGTLTTTDFDDLAKEADDVTTSTFDRMGIGLRQKWPVR